MSTLEELISMGFDENISKLALEQCNTGNIEDVINWILCYAAESENEVTNESTCQESMKLVLVVRADLQMTPGKVAAQCVHAALAVAAKVETLDPTSFFYWKNEGEATICLRCSSEDELNGLETRAIASGLPTSVVHDAGRTQVASNTRTVLAIGPAAISRIDSITGHLKLY